MGRAGCDAVLRSRVSCLARREMGVKQVTSRGPPPRGKGGMKDASALRVGAAAAPHEGSASVRPMLAESSPPSPPPPPPQTPLAGLPSTSSAASSSVIEQAGFAMFRQANERAEAAAAEAAAARAEAASLREELARLRGVVGSLRGGASAGHEGAAPLASASTPGTSSGFGAGGFEATGSAGLADERVRKLEAEVRIYEMYTAEQSRRMAMLAELAGPQGGGSRRPPAHKSSAGREDAVARDVALRELARQMEEGEELRAQLEVARQTNTDLVGSRSLSLGEVDDLRRELAECWATSQRATELWQASVREAEGLRRNLAAAEATVAHLRGQAETRHLQDYAIAHTPSKVASNILSARRAVVRPADAADLDATRAALFPHD